MRANGLVLSRVAVSRLARAIAATLPARSAPAPAIAVGVRGRRIHFVDLLRLLASLQMVHGHTLDALMAEELRSGVVFERWSWGRGLVSVAFMVAAGMAFHLTSIARFDQHRADAAKVRQRFRRGAWLVVLGYLLHFPAGVFGGDAAAALRDFAMADVLQCIGISMLVLQTIVVLAKKREHVVWIAAGLAALAFALAPLGERLSPEDPWRFAINYLTHQGGSLFPLTPWAGFVMMGVVVAEIALPHGTRTHPDRPVPRLIALTAVVLALAGIAELVPFTWVTEGISKSAEPAFNLTKLGVVLGIITLLAILGRRIERLPRVLQILAGESLMLYVFHLLVIYGSGVGLYHLFGRSLSLPAALLVALVMILLTASVGLGWHRLKQLRSTPRASS